MPVHAARAARWFVRVVVGLGLLLALAAAVLWWWAGQEGSLDWLLKRVARGAPLHSEGVQGSLRGRWHIQRIAWEKDGLRLEAEDIVLEWQPLALLEKTLRLEEVRVARARVVDTRPKDDEPLKEPATLGLPWRVDVERLRVGSLAYEGRTRFEGGGLDARYAFDGLRHRMELAALQLAGGSYRGDVSLLAVAPLTLDAKLAGRFAAPVPGVTDRVPLAFDVRASGPMRALAADASLRVEGAKAKGPLPRATATARITPFERMPVPEARADFQQLDAGLFWPQAPHTLLSGHVEVVPEDKASYRMRADLRNADAGPWDAQRLPVASLSAAGQWRDGAAMLQSLAAKAGGGRVEGSGRWQGKGWTFDGKVQDVDPAQLHTKLAPVPLTGPVTLKGEDRNIDFDVALRAGRPRTPSKDSVATAAAALDLRELLAQGRFGGDAVSAAQLRVRTGDALLEGNGEWQLAAHAGKVRLQLHAPGLQGEAQGDVAETRGQGRASITSSDLATAQRWLARWPGADRLLAQASLRGQGQVQLSWQGGWRDPTVQARAGVQQLAWQPATSASTNAPPPWVVRDAVLQVRGRLRDAALDLNVQAEQGQRKVSLASAGRLAGNAADLGNWRGQVASLGLDVQDPSITPGPWRLQLQRPVDWHVNGGAFDLSAGEAVLHAPPMRSGAAATDARLAWSPVRRQGGQLTTSGTLSGLPMAWVELVGGQQLGGAALSGDLVFDAQWNAQIGSTMRIDASLARVRGDVNVLAETADGGSARVAAGVREARVNVSAQGEQIEFRLLWDSERAGHAEGQVRSRLAHSGDGWTWPADAPLAGRVQANLPRIGVWSVLAPPGWRLRGSVSADVRVAGTRSQPDLTGPVLADGLALRSVVDGIELRNGHLRAQLAGQRVVVEEFLLHGSPENGSDGGTLVAHGQGLWTPQGPAFEAEAVLTQLRASIRSDRQLTLSGPVSARVGRNGTEVTGELRFDRARIQIPDETPPRLADDVVVRNAPGLPATDAERRQKPKAGEGDSKLTLRIAFDFGNDFRVTGRGVDTRLAGKVEVRNAADGTPQITGLVRTEGGTFQAYGQRMNIERGELRFTGAADNPALDILAIRPNLTIKAGVQVTGRAQSPHIELYSDAGLSDAEILSYVVLGRSSAGSGAETALLQRAATALLAGRKGTGKGIAGTLGLDDLSVAPDGTNGAVVRLGKRFADNFYAAYERSLSGAMGTLFLFYDVSRRMTVRAEAGERTGVDLIFTFTFGEPSKK